MNETSTPASPLPEGRADGRATDFAAGVEFAIEFAGMYETTAQLIPALRVALRVRAEIAAPVVAVPGNEAEASSPDLAADATRPEAGEGRSEVLHWSHYEDDECIEDCPGCLREKVIEAAAQAEDGNYGNIGEDEATSLVDRMLAAVAASPDPLAAPVVGEREEKP